MPQFGDCPDFGFRVPGAYRHLVHQDCKVLAETRDYDPRQVLVVGMEDFVRRRAESDVAAEVMTAQRLEVGEPVIVERRRLGISVPDDAPDWLSGRSAQWVRVSANDVVSPANKPKLSER